MTISQIIKSDVSFSVEIEMGSAFHRLHNQYDAAGFEKYRPHLDEIEVKIQDLIEKERAEK